MGFQRLYFSEPEINAPSLECGAAFGGSESTSSGLNREHIEHRSILHVPKPFSKKSRPQSGYIEYDDSPLSINLIEEYRKNNQPLPSVMEMYKDKIDFHKVDINLNLVSLKDSGSKGVRTITINGMFVDGIGATDVAPKTEWVPKNESLTVSFTIDSIASVLQMVKIATPSITPNIVFHYQWNPLVAKVISGVAGKSLQLRLENSANQYLDGGHVMTVIFSRRRDVKDVKFTFSAEADYDMGLRGGTDVTKTGLATIQINESTPS